MIVIELSVFIVDESSVDEIVDDDSLVDVLSLVDDDDDDSCPNTNEEYNTKTIANLNIRRLISLSLRVGRIELRRSRKVSRLGKNHHCAAVCRRVCKPTNAFATKPTCTAEPSNVCIANYVRFFGVCSLLDKHVVFDTQDWLLEAKKAFLELKNKLFVLKCTYLSIALL